MEGTQRELREVTDELALIEDQLQALLERQAELTDKQRRLQADIKEAARAPSAAQNKDWEHAEFEWSKSLEGSKESVFNVMNFRPLQLSTMNATMAGHDCLLIMPTGGGKSLCFQLPAVISKGITLVVSPLVSLMEDQLMALRDRGVNATLLNAASSREEVNGVHAAMTDKKSELKLLYVTPEKLAKSKRFMNKLEKMHELGRFSRLVIDEVHCCSQWGHDFRPDYKFLGVMRRQFPKVPILGLTATATTPVITDVKKILGISNCLLFKASFNRTNLFYEVRKKPSSLVSIMDDMQDLIETRFNKQSGIVYCFSRKDSEDVARELRTRGIQAAAYHGDMDAKSRSAVHHMWSKNSIQVVVATVAFGMGIDKPDVRFVLHHSMSKSMENYYQESGRAGRDDKPAYCILYTSFPDVFRQSTMVFTEQTGLEKLYTMVTYAYDAATCRRALIARHFGERWNAAQCEKMCDHCQSNQTVIKQNVAGSCRDVIRLIEHAQASKQRVTALKVLDAWMGKGATSLRVAAVKVPRMSRVDCEQVLAHMLIQGYLREDFHFTPYSTISYLLPGPRSTLLKSSDQEVLIDCAKSQHSVNGSGDAKAKGKVPSGDAKAKGKVPSGDVKAKGKVPSGDVKAKVKVPSGDAKAKGKVPSGDAKPKVKVPSGDAKPKEKVPSGDAKPKGKVASSFVSKPEPKVSSSHNNSANEEALSSGEAVKKRKRSRIIVPSDSEDSDLDFLDDDYKSPKRNKTLDSNKAKTFSKVENGDSDGSCIVIDDTGT